MSARGPSCGFTLIELLVVITIIGVVALVAAPALPVPGKADPASAAAAALRRTAAVAARLDRVVDVTYEPVTGRLISHLGDSVAAVDTIAGAGVTGAAFRFFPDGRSIGGPLVSPTSHGQRRVEVDPWTSHVRVERP